MLQKVIRVWGLCFNAAGYTTAVTFEVDCFDALTGWFNGGVLFFSVKNGAFCLEFEIFYLSLYCTS